MTNNIRRLISIIWLWNLCVGDIVEENLIRYESTSDIEGLAVTTRECGNDDPTNKAVVRLEIDCDENISTIRNDVNALRDSMKKEFYAIKQSLQNCSSDIISDISKLLSKDECAGINNCSANADCIDGVLSYRCNCRPGYQGDGFTCSDINECSTGNHKCHSQANCTNTIGSYTCRCRPPYSGNGYICNEECAGTNNCSANADCIDGVLSYRCNCRPGYQGDGFTCNDIDECSTGNHKCHSRANCTNTIGSYTCRCRPPYSGNGYTCNDIACGSRAKLIEGLGCVIPVTGLMIWTTG
ncbi:adhesion G protein-coupled receptor E2-like isoform X6 [Macrobrachium nipponense]|uniref:adhesion G protein-coupled receptor E2-like isoform X5 n=1 Tax=Macrobrachium nipponense TaxID=159736 RepID=UPI0030C8B8C2